MAAGQEVIQSEEMFNFSISVSERSFTPRYTRTVRGGGFYSSQQTAHNNSLFRSLKSLPILNNAGELFRHPDIPSLNIDEVCRVSC